MKNLEPIVTMVAAVAGALLGGRGFSLAVDGTIGVLLVAGLALYLNSALLPTPATVRAPRAR